MLSLHREALRAVPAALHKAFRGFVTAVALVGIQSLSGCAGADRELVVGPAASDPSSPVARVSYRSTTSSYLRQRPVAPTPWRGQNERVMPSPKSEQ
jgi:hypothetical protein